ncbi:MAG TPA: LamG-like jellyroll fold domain-containing protein [Bacteroidia bacterium]
MKKILLLFTFFFLASYLPFAQNALDFDGVNDHIDCGNDTSLQISGKNITLEAWVYPTAWKTNAYEGNVICKEYNTNNYGYMLRVGDGGKLNFALGDGTWHEITTAAIMSLNTWQHIAGTFDGNKMRVYLNGVAVDSLSFTGNITATPLTNLIIGAHVGYSRYFQGQIDEVRIWNICKTEAEIYANKGSEMCGTAPGLRACYKFNQGKAGLSNTSVKKLNDISGYYNTGTLNNFFLGGTGSNWVKGQNYIKAAVYSNDSADVCDRYFSPSKKFTWTSSGTYKDTLPTFFGCDSVISIKLKVRKASNATVTVYACDSFKSPSGLYVWKTNGIYFDKIKNVAKCDSNITIKLTIGGSRDTVKRSACEKYISLTGKTYTSSGIIKDTLRSYKGCDSIIVTQLTIKKSTSSTISANACRIYQSPSTKKVWSLNGTYLDTIPNKAGCDSFITINLKILNSIGTATFSSCKPVKSPSLKYTWTNSGVYMDTIANKAGCDSFITATVKISQASSSTLNINACRSYISPKGVTLTKSGAYTEKITNVAGCDSTITIHLTIQSINTKVTQDGKHLSAAIGEGSYQWLNCSNYAAINGETSANFKATAIGSYAVEIRDSACIDTSDCYTVNSVGIRNMSSTIGFQLLPNPNTGEFNIVSELPLSGAILSIYDLSGRCVYSETINTPQSSFKTDLEKGIYTVIISSESVNMREVMIVN